MHLVDFGRGCPHIPSTESRVELFPIKEVVTRNVSSHGSIEFKLGFTCILFPPFLPAALRVLILVALAAILTQAIARSCGLPYVSPSKVKPMTSRCFSDRFLVLRACAPLVSVLSDYRSQSSPLAISPILSSGAGCCRLHVDPILGYTLSPVFFSG